MFDALHAQREAIETAFGQELNWMRRDEVKRSCVDISKPFDGFDEEVWDTMIGWMAENVEAMEAAFQEPLARINQQLKTGGISPNSTE